jgi:hypothetical protein
VRLADGIETRLDLDLPELLPQIFKRPPLRVSRSFKSLLRIHALSRSGSVLFVRCRLATSGIA